ncbi:four-helix bundle copper-binding protein [Roseomonas sp. NAR14]|uniref:Four-helix bundle copper-binding protein n=1 Tax=Roseomonas acroporae TaxID=2937791 RepID=A0A9X2BUJ3_9PROT|nr:four-helix bundle copper-binding protein [Roseomonas acroporae]MCK8785547.1 four-helix bundle copper-binding protein [Roseomonas acroporae]
MDMNACIEACLDCHRTCLATIAHCLGRGGHHAEAAHIGIMMDCAQICAVSADFMIRQSPHHPHLCAECAEICGQCAASCENHPDADDAMRRCAEACRRCASLCGQMGVRPH